MRLQEHCLCRYTNHTSGLCLVLLVCQNIDTLHIVGDLLQTGDFEGEIIGLFQTGLLECDIIGLFQYGLFGCDIIGLFEPGLLECDIVGLFEPGLLECDIIGLFYLVTTCKGCFYNAMLIFLP